ncbi:hypothetical protein NGM99_13685 [Mesorhizobium sp. RP14(2022)]|uniref:Uncharacterized protein n=1 Tax=Mesorhizobium liriopis TaxID=2953882 RepID=A0ABT1C7N0_9HYPH|nr:hypothetical protein [Mesorhizobium liriopis]MCO6050830.1 hypothetical protein [Mesorhizobium liriopis]
MSPDPRDIRVCFVVYDIKTRDILFPGKCPPDLLDAQADGIEGAAVMEVAELPENVADWRPHLGWRKLVPRRLLKREAVDRLSLAVLDAETRIDQWFAGRIAMLIGPMAPLHALKRAQAETGGGALVADDADRQAILARAAEQDAQLAALDAQRRELKAQVRAAANPEQIAVPLALLTTES